MKIKRVEHIAIAVNSLKQSIDLLRDTFGLPLEYEEQIGQTRLAMLPVGQSYIELLEGQGPESGVTKWISEKGTGLFHICFEADDIDGALAELKAKGVKLRDETPRIGHGGARIAFIDPSSTGDVLIELAESRPATAPTPYVVPGARARAYQLSQCTTVANGSRCAGLKSVPPRVGDRDERRLV